MDARSVFYQTSVDDEIATPINETGHRIRYKAKCPGTKENLVTIGWGGGYGFKNVENLGSCTIYICLYDDTGTSLGCYDIEPGGFRSYLAGTSNTAIVKFGCDPECGGSDAIIEFDAPLNS